MSLQIAFMVRHLTFKVHSAVLGHYLWLCIPLKDGFVLGVDHFAHVAYVTLLGLLSNGDGGSCWWLCLLTVGGVLYQMML